jgi:hypothetical protein
MKHLMILGAAALFAASALGQQPNAVVASMTIDDLDGPGWPIVAPINVAIWNPDITLTIKGPPIQPFILASAPAGVLPLGVPTQFGIVDLDLSGGLTVILDGTGPLSMSTLLAHTDATGSASFTSPLWPGAAGLDIGLQCLMSVPGSPAGFILTAATHLTTVDVPINAKFVSYSRGAAGNPGTAGSPFLTVQAGISAAFASGPPYPEVYLEAGAFPPSGTIQFQPAINVIGGFDPVSWLVIPGASTTISGSSAGTLVANAQTISVATSIQRIRFQAPNATSGGGASIAFRAKSCTSALGFTDCEFVAGNAQAGASGAAGVAGEDGGDGVSPGGILNGGGAGGAGHPNDGGNGGDGGSAAGGNGSAGDDGVGTGAGSGGSGSAGAFCSLTNPGGDGGNGNAGGNGAGGTITSSPGGAIDASGNWTPGTAGSGGASGGNGKGGGGGGGSGGKACTASVGNGGGGGGGGGGAGTGGGAGGNGGASFATHLHDSSPIFTNCTFTAGNGGTGGNGGAGASGGAGGSGGNGNTHLPSHVGAGGDAGNGGAGGKGGGGAAGHGGPSWCVYKSGTTSNPTFLGTLSLLPGVGGVGGNGGTAPSGGNPGQAGSGGPSGTIN